jgi:hypothetical protein
MNSYESQKELKLNAEIVHDGIGAALDSKDKRYHYGLKFANTKTIDKQQIALLISYYVDIS